MGVVYGETVYCTLPTCTDFLLRIALLTTSTGWSTIPLGGIRCVS